MRMRSTHTIAIQACSYFKPTLLSLYQIHSTHTIANQTVTKPSLLPLSSYVVQGCCTDLESVAAGGLVDPQSRDEMEVQILRKIPKLALKIGELSCKIPASFTLLLLFLCPKGLTPH